MMEYVPLIVGAGLFIGAILAGIFKGKKETSEEKVKVVGGTLQDNYSMVMMSEQLRVNKEQMEKVVDSMRELSNELERLREHAKDIQKELANRKAK